MLENVLCLELEKIFFEENYFPKKHFSFKWALLKNLNPSLMIFLIKGSLKGKENNCF